MPPLTRIRTAVAALASIVLILGCKEKPPAERMFDEGHVDGGRYVNDYFGLSMELPKGWVLQDKKEAQALMDKGVGMISKDKEEEHMLKKAMEVQTANLVTLFHYEPGSPVSFNPSFIVMAENVHSLPGIKEGKDYLFHARQLMESSRMPFTYDGELPDMIVDGVDFQAMKMSVHSPMASVDQNYYCAVKDGFALSVVMSYQDSATADTLRSILRTTTFRDHS